MNIRRRTSVTYIRLFGAYSKPTFAVMLWVA